MRMVQSARPRTGFGFQLFIQFQLSALRTMNATGGEKWTSAQSDLLKATYLVTYDEEMRPNWDRVEERYNSAALHYGFPKRTNIGLRKRWSRLQASHLQHDPNRVAEYVSLVRQPINGQMLSSSITNIPVYNTAKSRPEADVEKTIDNYKHTYGVSCRLIHVFGVLTLIDVWQFSLFPALPQTSLGPRHEPHYSSGQEFSLESAQKQKTI